ncbi:hypothetical protein LTR09_007342 [Extremus antarcticus]|uniref:Mitochondrial zinc maintenance protein 1, mitochondrial n=1 Tax=Extremus antarcticus TaxID=702011 RepID=A0AAJ0DJS7_9PEZI|nr:hypothetical protein LTR09_007342 [Extremus antarcticus]
MPDLRIPIRSGAHRIAAIALYRALLTQCAAVPFAVAQQDELQNIVRNRFKQAQHSHSIQRLRVAFEAGYEAIDHLDNAVAGSEESTSYIVGLLERAPVGVKTTPTHPTAARRGGSGEKAAKGKHEIKQPRTSLFDRPLPLEKLSGPRHVPVLFNANRVPVLRLKKPQPQALSLYIHKRVVQRQKWHNQRMQLQRERVVAGYEDEWDELVSSTKGAPNTAGLSITEAMAGMGEREEGSWEGSVDEALHVVHGRIVGEKEKNREMAAKMQGVVDREREVFERESWERKEEDRRRRELSSDDRQQRHDATNGVK